MKDGTFFSSFKDKWHFERAEKSSVLHFFQNFNGNATGDVSSAERQNFQREVASFGTINVGPEIQRFHADRAGFVESVDGDFRSGIGVGVSERSVLDFGINKFVQGAEAAARENQFPADLGVAAAHESEQFDLLFGVRSEIGVAAFRRADD